MASTALCARGIGQDGRFPTRYIHPSVNDGDCRHGSGASTVVHDVSTDRSSALPQRCALPSGVQIGSRRIIGEAAGAGFRLTSGLTDSDWKGRHNLHNPHRLECCPLHPVALIGRGTASARAWHDKLASHFEDLSKLEQATAHASSDISWQSAPRKGARRDSSRHACLFVGPFSFAGYRIDPGYERRMMPILVKGAEALSQLDGNGAGIDRESLYASGRAPNRQTHTVDSARSA